MHGQDEEPEMSEREAMADETAKRVVSHLMEEIRNPEKAAAIVDTYMGHFQQMVGRAVLRFAGYVLVVILIVGTFHYRDWADWFPGFFRGGGK